MQSLSGSLLGQVTPMQGSQKAKQHHCLFSKRLLLYPHPPPAALLQNDAWPNPPLHPYGYTPPDPVQNPLQATIIINK